MPVFEFSGVTPTQDPAKQRYQPRHRKVPDRPNRSGSESGVIAAIVVGLLATAMPPSSALDYTVAPGDALGLIAAEHGVSVSELAERNSLQDPDFIVTGEILVIPDAALARHRVVVGETLWAIARSYDVSIADLAKHNNIENQEFIRAGAKLEIPSGATTNEVVTDTDTVADAEVVIEESRPAAPVAPAPDGRTYTVASGDTLSTIAAAHGVSLDALLERNGLTTASIIRPGDTLSVGATALPDDLPSDLLSDPDRLALLPVFDQWAAEYGVPADLMKALAYFESGWNNTKHSSADAVGIGQILPITTGFINDYLLDGGSLDPAVPADNIALSTRYMRYLLDHTGDVRLAVAAYYQGLTAVRQYGIYRSSEFYVDGIISLRSRFD